MSVRFRHSQGFVLQMATLARRIRMRYKAVLSYLLALSALSIQGRAAQTEEQHRLTGRWDVKADIYSTPVYLRLELAQQGEKLTGTSNGDKLEGSVNGSSIHVLVKPSSLMKDGEIGTEELKGTFQNGIISGTLVWTEADNPTHPTSVQFTATPALLRRKGPLQRYGFTPTVFYRQFSALNKPVLTVSPGDTIHTTTLDALGVDAGGVRRAMRGNPQTGPFYVATAMPGDTLVVHLKRLRLNRDWAISTDGIVSRGLNRGLASQMKDGGKLVRWHLDLAKGVASPEKPGEHLAHYSVPLRPMLGGIGVAPSPSQAAPDTRDSGSWGGNMDFNENVEGATVYLPVGTVGALLYVGDGHAAQGDGELNGDALETSMDVEFTVDVIPGERIPNPRVESPTHIIAMGVDGSLDEAFRSATANMAQWLKDEYKLTPSEIAEMLGTAAEYKVSEVADRNVGIVLKISKERLRTLTPTAK
jgi:amidase